jgi:hypothetical protein
VSLDKPFSSFSPAPRWKESAQPHSQSPLLPSGIPDHLRKQPEITPLLKLYTKTSHTIKVCRTLKTQPKMKSAWLSRKGSILFRSERQYANDQLLALGYCTA